MTEHQPTPEQAPEPIEDRAARIISDLMDMLAEHPEYHGSGPIDEGFKFLLEREQAQKRRELEDQIAINLHKLSNFALRLRMERAPDFSTDDEEIELTRRLKLEGLSWRWSNDMFDPKIEVYKPGEEE